MTAKTRYLNTYRLVRSMNIIWALMALFCLFKAVTSISTHAGEPSVVMFMMWVGAATGLVIAIKRGNKARAKVNG